jgi:hypothetical protein
LLLWKIPVNIIHSTIRSKEQVKEEDYDLQEISGHEAVFIGYGKYAASGVGWR